MNCCVPTRLTVRCSRVSMLRPKSVSLHRPGQRRARRRLMMAHHATYAGAAARAVSVHHDVLRLDVAVDDTALVAGAHRHRHLCVCVSRARARAAPASAATFNMKGQVPPPPIYVLARAALQPRSRCNGVRRPARLQHDLRGELLRHARVGELAAHVEDVALRAKVLPHATCTHGVVAGGRANAGGRPRGRFSARRAPDAWATCACMPPWAGYGSPVRRTRSARPRRRRRRRARTGAGRPRC